MRRILLILLLFPSYLLALQSPDVVVFPDSTNQFARYTITTRLEPPAPWIHLEANIDSIIVIFTAYTILPDEINPSLITVNNVPSGGVTVRGQRMSILAPVEIRNFLEGTRDITISIAAECEIRNPSRKGYYHLKVLLVNSDGAVLSGPHISADYLINTSHSHLEVMTVASNPPIIDNAAAYRVYFNTGASGYLKAGLSRISIKFDNRIKVPKGTLSGVKVNGTAAIATGSMNTVVITTPVEVGNQETVRVSFASGTGIRNPISTGEYRLAVKTSYERTYSYSHPFRISDGSKLTISDITINPSRANSPAAYEINFITGAAGALIANVDTVSLIFERNTILPDLIAPSDVLVSVGGYSDHAVDVQVHNRHMANNDTLCIVMPIDAGSLTNVTVRINERAGLVNPSEMGRYRIAMFSSQELEETISNPFLVNRTDTKIKNIYVITGSRETNQTSSYGIGFNLGERGRLKSGISSIKLSFNHGYSFSTSPADYDSVSLSISDKNPVYIDAERILVDNQDKTLEIRIPDSIIINNKDRIYLQIGGRIVRPITNPSKIDNYIIGVSTSVESLPVSSQPYTIGGTALAIEEIFVSDSTVNIPSAYTFIMTVQTALNRSANDYIQITFPEGTDLPETISSSDVTINGIEAGSVSIVQSTRMVAVSVPQFFIGAGELITIVFSKEAGIINPAVPSEKAYRAVLRTSRDITPVATPAYHITGGTTEVSISDVSVMPAVKNMSNVSYDVKFITSSSGRLSGSTTAGAGTITIDFDTVTYIPPVITASHIRINGRICSEARVITAGLGGAITISLPADLIVDNDSPVMIHFESPAGLGTQDYAGDYQLRIRTSSDTVFTETNGVYHIEDLQSLVINSVEAIPSTQNANAAYAFRITTGSEGELAVGDSIHLIFPSSTILPAVVSMQDIIVNGYNLSQLPIISGDTLSIPVPIPTKRMSPVKLLINKGAGIFNPVLQDDYSLKIATSSERNTLSSPVYRIRQTTSTVSNVNFIAEPVTVGLDAIYKVNFKIGSNGRLLSGVSTITITFDEQTLLSQSVSDYDSSFIIIDKCSTAIPKENIAVSGPILTFILPEDVLIKSDDRVSVILRGKSSTGPIRNPQTTGAYRIQVKTSVEKRNIVSALLNISGVPPVAKVIAKILPDVVNAPSSARISFRVQREINESDGTITLTFPHNTLVPATIDPSELRIAHAKLNPENFTYVSTVSTNQANRTVTVTVPSTIPAGNVVEINILPEAGFENPSIPGGYFLKVRTSTQEVDGKSGIYILKPSDTEIVNLSVNIVPNIPGAFSRVSFSFTTGSRGRLISGASKINLILPGDNLFTQGVPALSKVTVNGVPAHSLELKSKNRQTADTLVITIPTTVTIGNETDVTLVIDSTSGLRNASTTATLIYATFTSVETNIQGDHYALPVQLTNFTSESKSGYIFLEWITESKLEDSQWMIERKELSQLDYEAIQNDQKNIESMGNQFKIISYLEARESAAIQVRYTYVDSVVELGAVYAYRLSDINDDGKVNYHGVLYQDVTPASEFILFKNIPNPFNSSTTIRYYLPVEAEVDLRIYDLVGQEISNLVDDIEKSGYHEIVWNSSNRNGNPVASGMYVISFRTRSIRTEKEYAQLMKILLVR